MGKVRTTRKSVRENHTDVICVGYCNLQHLLGYESADYYCTRAEGWACDIYTFGSIAISTGYAPFGNIRPSYELCKKHDNAARKLQLDSSMDWDEKKNLLRGMIDGFIGECINLERGKKCGSMS